MPDVLGGLLARRAAAQPSTLGMLASAINQLPTPQNLVYGAAKGIGSGLLSAAQTTQKFMGGDPVSVPEVLGASLMGVGGGLLAPPGGTALGAGPIRRGFVQGGKQLLEDVKAGKLGLFDSTKPSTIAATTKAEKGYTVHLQTGEVPKEGLMAGVYRNADPRTSVIPQQQLTPTGLLTRKQMEAHAETNAKTLSSPKHYYGTWQAGDGTVYLDVARKFPAKDVRPATKFAEKTAQKTIFDLGAGKELPVGDFPGFIAGTNTPPGVVPFSTRLQEQAAGGRMYMHGQPTAEWWKGQPNMQRVYGEQLMPQQRGLLSATSNNTAPPPNVAQASEYMRRHLKGEPMIQPDFRVPENALAGKGYTKPGSRMPLEENRTHNLLTAASGATDPAAYHGPVVREKVGALGGNRGTIVLDRILTRLGEQPSAGIFATEKAGKSPVGATRNLMLNVITDEAKIAGEHPDTFSGNAWAGIREHVKETGELYGTPLAKTQMMTAGSESKSFDDLFMDRIRQKAQHLGVTVKKMESMLRNGDAELLSYF